MRGQKLGHRSASAAATKTVAGKSLKTSSEAPQVGTTRVKVSTKSVSADRKKPARERNNEPTQALEVVDSRGLGADEIQRAIDYLASLQDLRPAMRTHHRAQVEAALLSNVKLISDATQKQAARSAGVRLRLLEEEGFETFESLAQIRRITESSARTWVSRQRKASLLFTVEYDNKVLIPKFQLTEEGKLDDAVSTLVTKPLLEAGVDPWTLWAWSTRPTGLLSDQVPTEVARVNKRRIQKAVSTYIADRKFPIGT